MHQGAWLVWILAAGVVAVLTTNPFYLMPLLVVAWIVFQACRTDGPGARSFRMFLVIGLVTIASRTLLVLFGPINRGSIAIAFLEGLRLAVLLVLFGTFNAVSDPFRVLRLAPRRWHEPALATALALSIAPRTIAAAGRVREAQRLRGIHVARWRSLPALAVPVLETGMEEAVMLAESMDARGHGRGPRSRYRPDRWDLAGASVALIASLAAVLFVVASVRGWSDILVATFPLQWPQVAGWLMAATLSFSLPALIALGRRS